MEKYLYHLTTKDQVNEIMQNGLIPLIGQNSASVHEQYPYVYLCREEDIPYWKILLKKDVLIQIQTSAIDEEKIDFFSYPLYGEYLYPDSISSSNLKIIPFADEMVNNPKIMKDLCIDYLYCISKITTMFARYYCDIPSVVEKNSLVKLVDSFLAVKDRLDYSIITNVEKAHALKDIGDEGEYTFVDTFDNTKTKMYEQLLAYPDDDLSERRKAVYDFIINNFSKEILEINTGGWCRTVVNQGEWELDR